MRVVNFSEMRKDMASIMDSCCEDHELTIITRQKEEPVVMMSLADYNSLKETVYLMESPANYAMLMESLKEARQGKARRRKLIEGK